MSVSMSIITPGIGLVFWLTIAFLILLFLLGKFAWKPILSAVNKRNADIDKAMFEADQARLELKKLKADNERIINETKLEKEAIIKDARDMSAKIIGESKDEAKTQALKILEDAQVKIEMERKLAVKDIKSQVILHAVAIAEKILKDQMQKPSMQEEYLNSLVKDIDLN